VVFTFDRKTNLSKKKHAGYEPAEIGDEWTTSTPEAENINRAKLDSAFQLLYKDNRFWMARSLLVIHNGKSRILPIT